MKAEKAILFVLLLLSLSVCCRAAGDGDAHERGRAALKRGEIDRAIEQFSEAIGLNPENYRYYNDRGVAYKRVGDLDKAIADYTKALEIRPGWTHALNNRGVGLMEKGRYRDSIRDFTEALKHGGLESKLHTNRGIALARLGKHREALEDFRKAVSLSPTDYRSFVEMGRSLEKLGESEKAYRIYQLAEGLVSEPTTLRFLAERISALSKNASTSPAVRSDNGPSSRISAKAAEPAGTGSVRGSDGTKDVAVGDPGSSTTSNLDGYEKLYRACRKRAPKKFSRASGRLFRRGTAFERKGDLPKALVMFEDSLQLTRRNRNLAGAAWAMFEIGKVHSRTGRPARALRYLKRASRLFRNLKSRDEALLALVEMATATRSAGLLEKASALYRGAAREARSRGRLTLAQSLEKMSPSGPVARRASAPPRSGMRVDAIRRPGRRPAAGRRRHMIEVGRGPVQWSKSGRKRLIASVAPGLSTRRPLRFFKPRVRAKIKQPAREIFWVKRSLAAEPSMKDYLKRLKHLAGAGDDAGMIVLLEELAERYAKKKKYERAQQCLTVSVALREKLGMTKGLDKVLLSRGILREKRGHAAAGLEDLTRAAFTAKIEGNKRVRKTALLRAKKLAASVGLDSAKTLRTLARLWGVRRTGERGSDTHILSAVGTLYEKAGRLPDALTYFKRASASIAVRSSDLLSKMGKTEQADRTRKQAMAALKRLDYSRYLQMIGKPKKARSPSRNR
jgi:tetratricopeptide (TPR) repeat protein